jgi:hypothetical protein
MQIQLQEQPCLVKSHKTLHPGEIRTEEIEVQLLKVEVSATFRRCT